MIFDSQASAYEERVGLPEAISRQIAAQLLEGLPAGALVVDVGAGTGVVGRELVASHIRYLGIDVSRPMLLEFGEARGRLLQADANQAWPIADKSADVILFSRSAHLLKSERTLGEVLRIAAPGCKVFVGRVRRPRESAGEQLKRRMQELMRARNLPGKNGERAKRDFLEALPGRVLEPRASGEWTEELAPIESLESWRGKDGLGGRMISAELRHEILDELHRWAENELGDLSHKRTISQHYELEGVQLGE